MLRVLKFSGMRVRFPKPRARRCALQARMDAPKLSRHNWRKCIGNRTASLFAMAFFTITNRRGADKIRKKLGWKPAGTFRELVREMVEAELAAIDSRD